MRENSPASSSKKITNRAHGAGLGVLIDLDDHDLRAVLSRADGGHGTKVRTQKGRYLFFLIVRDSLVNSQLIVKKMIKAVVEIFQTHGTDGNFGKMALNHLRSSDDHRLSHFPLV